MFSEKVDKGFVIRELKPVMVQLEEKESPKHGKRKSTMGGMIRAGKGREYQRS